MELFGLWLGGFLIGWAVRGIVERRRTSRALDGARCPHENVVGDPYGCHCIDCGMANPPRK